MDLVDVDAQIRLLDAKHLVAVGAGVYRLTVSVEGGDMITGRLEIREIFLTDQADDWAGVIVVGQFSAPVSQIGIE